MTIQNGTAGGDDLRGTAGADTLFGLAGDDQLNGGGGSDGLFGGAGDDLLLGYAGEPSFGTADRLDGGSGDDLIYFGGHDVALGGLGDDELAGAGGKLTGGAGADTFSIDDVFFSSPGQFLAYKGHNEITDFQHGVDRVVIGVPSAETETDRQTFDTLDSNHDGKISGLDDGVSVKGGNLKIDFEARFHDVDWAKGDNSLTLDHVSSLTIHDFIA